MRNLPDPVPVVAGRESMRLRLSREETMIRSTLSLSPTTGAILLLAGLTLTAPTEAASWPERTVKIVTTSAAGSSGDVTARTLADLLAKRWIRPVVVENRPGADGIIGAQGFLELRDGHALLFTTHSTFTVVPLLHEKLLFDPVRDFAPITLAVEDFLAIVASPSLPANTLSEFVSLARSKPGALNWYAVPGSPYLSYLAFQKREGFATTFVPYRNPATVMTDLAEGRVHVAVVPMAFALGQLRAGKIKALAVTNSIRTPAAPEVPTAREAGYPDIAFGGLLGLFGPRDMPLVLRDRIAAEVGALLKESDVARRLANLGLVTRGTTPAEFSTILDEQRSKWIAIAREHDFKPKVAQ
jgi:tripartite-type tricarboxylate transporter receptor subunit TctC